VIQFTIMKEFGWSLTDWYDALENHPYDVGAAISYISAVGEAEKLAMEGKAPTSPEEMKNEYSDRWMSKRRMEAMANENAVKAAFGKF